MSKIQILGLRDYFDPKTNQKRKAEKFFDRGWRAESVADLFLNIEKYLELIPEKEHYNLYFTAANCLEVKGRKLEYQWIMPIDIDDIDLDKLDDYISVTIAYLNLPREKVGIVATGNGLQFHILMEEPIEDEEYFDEHRIYYKALCGGLAQELYLNGLLGSVDTSVFSPARLLRLPNTKNIKDKKGEKQAVMVQRNIEPVPFDLVQASGVPVVDLTSQMSDQTLKRLPPPDSQGVQDGCDFIKWCKAEPETVSEPQWYAMLSIIGRLEDGRTLAHEYSRDSSNYNEHATDLKYEQAIKASGPRTCDNINSIWDGCHGCPSFGKCKSPITLQSKTFIKTAASGFYNTHIDLKTGEIKRGKPNFDDLMQQFENTNPFMCSEDGGMVYIHSGKCWEYLPVTYINNFAEDTFDPKPDAKMCSEFRTKLLRNHLFNLKFFNVDGSVNFNNGILSLESGELTGHNSDLGFTYVLPFDYDRQAECPRFDSFLEEVTCGDTELQQVLLEFMGYALSGMDCSIGQKALILVGEGSNGKSVFMDLLIHLAGEGNYSTLSMGNEISRLENRYQLDGKLFNVSEETPTNAMMDSTVFKALVTGGIVQARKLYCDSYSMRNKAKIIMACNELPKTKDLSHGMFRRLLIVPFRAQFDKAIDGYDPHVREKLFAESSGIFNRIFKALVQFKERSAFADSVSVDNQIRDYRQENDTVSQWWDACMIKDGDLNVPSSHLYSMYKMDCENDGEKPMTQMQFTARLSKMLPESVFARKRIEGKVQRCIIGYRLAEQGDDDE